MDEVEVAPELVQFCCDPDAPFPQVAGNLEVTNDSEDGLVIDDVEIPSGETVLVPIRVFSCGDQSVDYIIRTDPRYTHTVEVEDRCPNRVEDPEETTIGDPSLDVLACESAPSGAGTTWVGCEVAGAWPPSETLWSWFVRVFLNNATGQVLVDCTTQRHDGTPLTFCDVGDVADLEVRDTDTGPVFVFTAEGAATFEVVTGTVPVEGQPLTGDDVQGDVGDEDVDVPGQAP
jgi:hypothetical protein